MPFHNLFAVIKIGVECCIIFNLILPLIEQDAWVPVVLQHFRDFLRIPIFEEEFVDVPQIPKEWAEVGTHIIEKRPFRLTKPLLMGGAHTSCRFGA